MADIYSSTGNLDDIILAEQIHNVCLDALQENVKVVPKVRNFTAPPDSNVYSVPVWGTLSASTVTETADITSTALTTSQVSITYGEVGLMSILTDKAREVSKIGMLAEQIGRAGARAIGLAMDTSLTALFDTLNGNTDVGTSGSTMSLDILLQGIYALEANYINGPMTAFLHPVQVKSLRSSILTSSAQAIGWKGGDVFGIQKAARDGFVGNIFGVDVYQTTLVETTNGATADREGALIAADPDECPLGIAIWRPTRIEMQRDASRRGTEVVVTAAYGVAEIRDTAGICVLSL